MYTEESKFGKIKIRSLTMPDIAWNAEEFGHSLNGNS